MIPQPGSLNISVTLGACQRLEYCVFNSGTNLCTATSANWRPWDARAAAALPWTLPDSDARQLTVYARLRNAAAPNPAATTVTLSASIGLDRSAPAAPVVRNVPTYCEWRCVVVSWARQSLGVRV